MTTLRIEGMELQPLSVAHADQVFAAAQDARIYEFIPQDPPATLDSLRRRYERLQGGISPNGGERWLNWVVFIPGAAGPIGTVQATVQSDESALIAYTIFPEHWGRGHGRAATRVMIDHVFGEYDISRVIARIDTRNQRSIRMVEGLGLAPVGVIENADFFKGASSDEYEYELSREAWTRSRQG